MKFTHLIAAGLMVAGLGVSTTASAQDYRGDRYQRDGGYNQRGYDRQYNGGGYRNSYRGYNRNRRHGWNNGRRCHTEWRHRRRVTVCYR